MDAVERKRDALVEAAIAHWAPRFVTSGVPLTDFEEVTGKLERWDDWRAAWSARGAIHEALGDEALARRLQEDQARWGRLIRKKKITVD